MELGEERRCVGRRLRQASRSEPGGLSLGDREGAAGRAHVRPGDVTRGPRAYQALIDEPSHRSLQKGSRVYESSRAVGHHVELLLQGASGEPRHGSPGREDQAQLKPLREILRRMLRAHEEALARLSCLETALRHEMVWVTLQDGAPLSLFSTMKVAIAAHEFDARVYAWTPHPYSRPVHHVTIQEGPSPP